MAKKNLGKTSIGMQANVAGLLCYLLWFITGIVFYIVEKENKFVRFHAMQSIVVFGFLFVVGLILPFIPIIGWLFIPFLWVLEIVVWIVLMIKAYQGVMFKLPIAGDIAEKNI